MGDRVVYGNTHSENGWRMVDQGSCRWITVPGTKVTLQIREGQPVSIMGAFAADYNVKIEPLRDADSACWTATNDVGNSNHLSGTGMDLNWNGNDNRTFRLGISKERAYPGKTQALDELLAFYEGMIFCGGVWSIRDWMHFQMGPNTYGAQNVERVNDFIRRKIRVDGFSTYGRSATPQPPPPPPPPLPVGDAIDVLVRATGISGAKAREVLPQVSFALVKSNCNTPRRIAAALAQYRIESGDFVYTEEIADGPENMERWKYKGRTWIQITWVENYRGVSQWCHSQGLVPTPDYFVTHPKELADPKWAALGPIYWWAVKYPQINEYADRGDIDNVSKWVNAPAWVDKPNKHANHEAERRAAYNKALALGDQLLVLTKIADTPGDDDDMSAEDSARLVRLEGMMGAMLAEWGPGKKAPSRSFMAVDGKLGDSPLGFLYWTDGNVHTQTLTWGYLFDVRLAVEVVETIAVKGVYEGSWAESEEFNAWLREFGQQYCQGLVAFKKALVSKLALRNQQVLTASTSAAPATINIVPSPAEIAAEIARLLPSVQVDTSAFMAGLDGLRAQLNEIQRSLDERTAVEVFEPDQALAAADKKPPTSWGDTAGSVVNSVQAWTQLLLSMDAPERESLGTALQALNLPISNGSKS